RQYWPTQTGTELDQRRDGSAKLPPVKIADVGASVVTTGDKIVALTEKFQRLGTVMAMFSSSPADAEKIARRIALKRDELSVTKRKAALRVAIALAKAE